MTVWLKGLCCKEKIVIVRLIGVEWKRVIIKDGCIWRTSVNTIVSFRHRCVSEDTSASWTPGLGVKSSLFAVGVKVTCAPSQSRQCGEESQALIRYFSCARRLAWENICSVSHSRGEERGRDRQSNNRNRVSTQPVVGEGEFSVNWGENKVNSRCRVVRQEARKW